jgi:hypothetical protein
LEANSSGVLFLHFIGANFIELIVICFLNIKLYDVWPVCLAGWFVLLVCYERKVALAGG